MINLLELQTPTAPVDFANERALAIEQLHQATAYYTAEPIVDQLLDMLAFPSGQRCLVDTSCGDGAFLGRALERLLICEPEVTDERIRELVHGWEIHYFAAAEARLRLQRILLRYGRSLAGALALAASIVTVGDFLTESPAGPAWDCVAGNPPFLRYAHLPDVLRREYEASLPDYSRGDMLHSFIDRMSRSLKPGGEISLVTSDRWLFSKCAERLRAKVGERLGLAHLSRLEGSTCFYRAKTRRAGTLPRVHPVAVVLRDKHLCNRHLTREPIYPDAVDIPGIGDHRLDEAARVRLAPWLGPHGIFVVNAQVASSLPASELVPVVDTDDIKGGVLSAPTRFAIRTSSKKVPCDTVMAHLDSQLHRMPKSKQRTKNRWLPPEPFAGVDLSAPSLLIPRIANSLRPTRLPAGVLPIDHGISIVSADLAGLDHIEAQLMRPEAQAWIRARAPRLENNFLSLTTTLLRALPVHL